MKPFLRLGALCGLAVLLALGGAWAYAGVYGVNVILRHGGTLWLPVGIDSRLLSPSMRLALGPEPSATPGAFLWRTIAPGFEVADLPAMVAGRAVDHVLLARIDPRRFRFVVRNAPAGDRVSLMAWPYGTVAMPVVLAVYPR